MADQLRKEKDSMGYIEVPAKALWGAQTQRSLMNFAIGQDLIPQKLIYSLAEIKQAAAIANHRLGVIDSEICNLIVNASSEIAKGLYDEHFPLKVWQTGSGTQTNMNINEVISNLASKATNQALGSHQPVHPNDHVNHSQSTNDIFPSAIQIACAKAITKELLPEIQLLIEVLSKKSQQWNEVVKIGRTHLQDAVPLTLGQEVSAWKDQILTAKLRVQESLIELYTLPLGGTAIGTGLNSPPKFDQEVISELIKLTTLPLEIAPNKFALMASHDGLVNTMMKLKMLAVSLLKIVNDIRLLSCGPRAGIGELNLPENEPGSSIMPGKVNPTQCEAMAMVCTQIIGLEVAVSIAGSGGHLQMNSYKPLIGLNLLKSIDLLHDAIRSCRIGMINNMEPNQERIKEHLNQSLMLITALTPKIGYAKATEIAKYAHKKNLSLKEAAIKLSYINEEEFNRIIDPMKMAFPHN